MDKKRVSSERKGWRGLALAIFKSHGVRPMDRSKARAKAKRPKETHPLISSLAAQVLAIKTPAIKLIE
jgi:hypothetical protein